MLITSTNIAALQVGWHNIYRQAYGDSNPWWSKVCSRITSTTRTERIGWMARQLKMRKWVGPRILRNLYTHTQDIENDPFELTVGVDRDDIEDDMLGVYNDRFSDMGRAAAKWPDQLAKTVLQANPTGFDGQALFSATHDLDPAGNQDNDFALALSAANYRTVREAMLAFTGEDGEPLGVNPNLLVVPPGLEGEAKDILMADKLASGASNVEKGTADYLMIPGLANANTTWYLMDVRYAVKPLIFQERRAPQFVMKDGPTNDNVFWDKDVVYGVDSRGQVAPGPWWLAAKSTP